MFIGVSGSGLFGKVDEVPGLFHVETKFGHMMYIPMVPLGSFVVLGKDGDSWDGVPIRLSFRSVLFGWLRSWLAAVGVCYIVVALLDQKEDAPRIAWIVTGAALLLASSLLTFPKVFHRASYRRARQLGEVIGLSPEGMTMIDRAYGRGEGAGSPTIGDPPPA